MKTIENFFDENRSAIDRIDLSEENRSAIDQVDLPIGHRERMEARLAQVAAKKRRERRVLWISSASAAAAVLALALWILPISSPEATPTILTAEQIEAIEVEKYYRSQRDRAIDEVCALLEQKQTDAATQISYGIAELKLTFEAEPLPKSLFNNDTQKYIALTIARYTAQTQVIEELKKTVTNI